MAVSDNTKLALDGAMGMALDEGYTLVTIAVDPATHDIEILTNIKQATPATLAAVAMECLNFLAETGDELAELEDLDGKKQRIYEA